MARFFNTTGPCNPCDHYMLAPAERLVGAQLQRYIKDKLYWRFTRRDRQARPLFCKIGRGKSMQAVNM